ncbi:NAD(P)/FAD-dependent oxidoreductase [Geomicrobium sp. JCM 19038]|uniref:NAD(P)/FAD-dependent oxidoreductase n=1 Tax=Geomicrobium sp. JCM 19038 TaxID=1460635 RepID=UPI00045F438E|nr:NAD(P)/FAD-dependent oxidoreductase [Geomicrobium sp. JCM 19038]GAK08243.1 thioredoxin reductase [Geomicrobium sp. JCM 19038]
MNYDVIVIGGGAAGLQATLTLARSRQQVALFDNETNRNRVTEESHNFITRDGTSPAKFRAIANEDLSRYPYVTKKAETIATIEETGEFFTVTTEGGSMYTSRRILLATGIQERFSYEPIRNYYGISVFHCPFCDGYELRDKALAIFASDEQAILHLTKLLYNWSTDLAIFTNGVKLDQELIQPILDKNIPIYSDSIKNLHGDSGRLSAVELADGSFASRNGGFVVPEYVRNNTLIEQLRLEVDEQNGITTDGFGRTSHPRVYVAGEMVKNASSSLLVASTEGTMTASMIVFDRANEQFHA